MSETSQIEAPINIEGETVNLAEGIYFIPFEIDKGKVIWLSLRKEIALNDFTYEELLRLQVVVQAKFRELTIVKNKNAIQVEQNDFADRYLDKLKSRIKDLEKAKKSDPLINRIFALWENLLIRPKL
jgi:hypothetical protein